MDKIINRCNTQGMKDFLKGDKTTMINFIDAWIIAAKLEIKNGSHHIEVEDAIIYVATRIKEKFIEIYK